MAILGFFFSFFYRVPEGEGSRTPLLFSNHNPLHFTPTPPTRKRSEVHVRPEICSRFWDIDEVGKLLAISPFTRFFVGGEGGPLRVLENIYVLIYPHRGQNTSAMHPPLHFVSPN